MFYCYSLLFSATQAICENIRSKVVSTTFVLGTSFLILPETDLSLLVLYVLHSQNKNESCAFIGLVGAPTAPALSFRLICFQYSL
nr:MAG TPA: hypothetical protein [Caudoviricetes sp.]